MYRPKLMGKPLVLDVTALLKRIQDAIQAVFKTYPATTGATGVVRIGTGSSIGSLKETKRQARERADSWKALSTRTALRDSLR